MYSRNDITLADFLNLICIRVFKVAALLTHSKIQCAPEIESLKTTKFKNVLQFQNFSPIAAMANISNTFKAVLHYWSSKVLLQSALRHVDCQFQQLKPLVSSQFSLFGNTFGENKSINTLIIALQKKLKLLCSQQEVVCSLCGGYVCSLEVDCSVGKDGRKYACVVSTVLDLGGAHRDAVRPILYFQCLRPRT